MENIDYLNHFPVAFKTVNSFSNRLYNSSKMLERFIWMIFFTFILRGLAKNFSSKGNAASSGMGMGPDAGVLRSKAKKFTLESDIKVGDIKEDQI